MRKSVITASAFIVFVVCCMFGITAYASTDLSSADVSLPKSSYTYTGSAITPSVEVTVNNGTQSVKLTKDVDYQLSYANNVNAGTATVTVTGIGGYSGVKTSNFEIIGASIGDVSIKNTAKGHPGVAPKYRLTYKGKKLVSGKDYTITASNIGKCCIKQAKIVVTGKGNFRGKKTMYASIYPKTITGFSVSERSTSAVTISWKSQENYNVSGYRVYLCDENGNNKKVYANVKTNKVTIKNRKAGEYIYFIVRAYKQSGDNYIYGEYSKVFLTCARPAKVTVNNAYKNTKKDTLTVKWNKADCTGYEIQYSTDKNFKKNCKKVSIIGRSKNSKSFTISKSDKTYYVRVRAFRRFNGGKTIVYGSWSSKLSTNYSKLYASYTTNYVNNANRTTNLKIASAAINGTIVYPGETFSFNKVVGKRTADKGYKPATIFTGSSGTAQSLGGGICQVASTMFNAVLYGNLGIVERHQHSQRVAYCPLGRDAAIYWGSEDFKFKNTTNYPIKISMKCANGQITCALYVSYDISPKKVTLNVKQNGKHFRLQRVVDGVVNYTTNSTY